MEEPERRDEDPEQGAGGGGADRASLGILFLAAAFALALLLTVVGLLAFATMAPGAPSPPELRGDAASAEPAARDGAALAV
ncbi:hypothetical protein WME76_41130 [Sorangium sp. So ce119]|uniref:hypothetical protein n=1 Tax=Sorangium sp. So ce119 TaxID=3133279 RepID=UPI003F600631